MSDRSSVYIPKCYRSPLHQHDTFYTTAAIALNHKHRVPDAQHAIHLYEAGEYDSCAEVCHMVLNMATSEAICARCHGLLARVEREVDDRCENARESVRLWEKVVLRSGNSRFPVGKAIQELIVMKTLSGELDREVEEKGVVEREEEDDSDEQEEDILIADEDVGMSEEEDEEAEDEQQKSGQEAVSMDDSFEL